MESCASLTGHRKDAPTLAATPDNTDLMPCSAAAPNGRLGDGCLFSLARWLAARSKLFMFGLLGGSFVWRIGL